MKLNVERLRGLALSETGFAFDPITGYTYNVNVPAIELLHRLVNGDSPEAVLKFIKHEYDADPNEIERDWQQFLARLEEYGLLSRKKA